MLLYHRCHVTSMAYYLTSVGRVCWPFLGAHPHPYSHFTNHLTCSLPPVCLLFSLSVCTQSSQDAVISVVTPDDSLLLAHQICTFLGSLSLNNSTRNFQGLKSPTEKKATQRELV